MPIIEAFTRGLSAKGVKLFFSSRVIKWEQDEEGNFLLGIGGKRADKWIRAGGVILAGGEILG